MKILNRRQALRPRQIQIENKRFKEYEFINYQAKKKAKKTGFKNN